MLSQIELAGVSKVYRSDSLPVQALGATNPAIVLADEPTANLDSKTGAGLIDLFRELNQQYQTTFLFASHDAMVIERAGRVIRLHDGRIVS